MADFLLFNDGAAHVLDHGLAGPCAFALSTKPCSGTGSHVVADKLKPTVAGHGFGEITGTGYGRPIQSAPAAVASTKSKAFTQMEYRTESHADWPASVKSVVLIIGETLICAWNLVAGGSARDLSKVNVVERVAPTYTT